MPGLWRKVPGAGRNASSRGDCVRRGLAAPCADGAVGLRHVRGPGDGLGPVPVPGPGPGRELAAARRPDPAPRAARDTARRQPALSLLGGTCLGLLGFFPPALWLTSLPMISAGAALLTENLTDSTRLGVIFLFPVVPCFALVLGSSLLFLGRVLVSSALGEVQHPRWPGWDM